MLKLTRAIIAPPRWTIYGRTFPKRAGRSDGNRKSFRQLVEMMVDADVAALEVKFKGGLEAVGTNVADA